MSKGDGKKPKKRKPEVIEGVAMYCNSECSCGILAVSINPWAYDDSKKNKHIRIKQVRITVEEL